MYLLNTEIPILLLNFSNIFHIEFMMYENLHIHNKTAVEYVFAKLSVTYQVYDFYFYLKII